MKTILKLENGRLGAEELHSERRQKKEKQEKTDNENKEIFNEFFNCLSEKQKELFEKYDQAWGDHWRKVVDQHYADGFITGARLMIDVLLEE